MKAVVYMGSSKRDLDAFPLDARIEADVDIERVRQGEMPRSFDTLPRVGHGAYEIRINIGTAWRVIYVANRKEAVYVLHCFQKKTRATSQKDMELAERRYRRIGKG